MMEDLKSRNNAENKQISEKRKKIFLLVFLFIFKLVIFPWLYNKIINYCLKKGSDGKKISERSNRNGFTLLEIVITVAITGIIAGASVISFYRYQPSLELSSVSRDMVSNLRYAQQLAISQQINYGIRFYPDQKKYQVVKYSSPEEVIKNVSFPQGIIFDQVSFTNSQLKFNIYGAAVEAGTIVIRNKNYNTSTIEVKPSGFVKLEN
ncbi:MAG: GspH/FimT family pseudopilin [Candidatus Paceibacterota bacterium]|jgi:prepilin-type N-terminal cleavage/methylation domain-containing protein